MTKRAPITRNLKCTAPGCSDYGHWQFDSRAEYDRHVQSTRTWTCCRHSKGAGVLSMDRLKVEWISEPSKPLPNHPNDPYRSFGSSGVILGTGYYAEGRDFPTGTRIKITAEVILPEEQAGKEQE